MKLLPKIRELGFVPDEDVPKLRALTERIDEAATSMHATFSDLEYVRGAISRLKNLVDEARFA